MIFDDGVLLGEDTSELQQAFEKYLNGCANDLSRRYIAATRGKVRRRSVSAAAQCSAAEAGAKDASDADAFYFGQAAGEVLRARRRIGGDDRVREVFAKAIRQTPFVITRNP